MLFEVIMMKEYGKIYQPSMCLFVYFIRYLIICLLFNLFTYTSVYGISNILLLFSGLWRIQGLAVPGGQVDLLPDFLA